MINSQSISIAEVLTNKVTKIIDTFDEYERNLFLLYYESDMTYSELSKEIGIPKISIYNTVRKIQKKIRERI